MQQEKILPWKNWEVVKLIGRGTYGDVYEIQKREAQYVTRAALKVIHVSLDEQKKRELELQMLQYQLNPHFLFNTLNSLRFVAIYRKHSPILFQRFILWSL